MFRLASCVAVLAVLGVWATAAQAVTIDVVPVGNLGNADDTHGDGYGAVDYAYNIGTYEVTAGQYRDFLNEVDPGNTNPYGLYNSSMDSNGYGCQITRNAGASTYDFSGRPSGSEADWVNRPVNYVSWYDAARFTNWLTTGGTEDGVYKFSEGTLQSIMDHQAAGAAYGTAYFIPTEDEWYKAAYYDPSLNGGVGGYYDYPTSNDLTPSNDLTTPDDGNNATFYDSGYTIGHPYYRTKVGAHENSESPYGTFDQGGNVWEWNETEVSASHGARGGPFNYFAVGLHASTRNHIRPSYEVYDVGFRVASIPEPSTAVLLTMGAVGLLAYAWRRRKRTTN